MNSIISFWENTSVRRVSLCIAVMLFFCMIYILNISSPLLPDDWGYSLIYNNDGQPRERVHNLYDIFTSLYNHYWGWGGRIVVHFIDYVLLFIDIRIARLLNSLAYMGLFFIIYSIINKDKKPSALLFIFLNTIFWLVQFGFPLIVFWMTGSANYIWGTLLLLLFIYPYYLFVLRKTSKSSLFKTILFFFWGVVSGGTNENAALAMIFLLITLVAYLKWNKVKVPDWAIWGIVGVCIGCAIMLLAPGNQVRASFASHNIGLSSISAFKLFKVHLYNLYNAGFWRLLAFLLVYTIFLSLFLKMNKARNKVDILFLSLAFFVAGLVAFVVLFPVPFFPRDVWTSIHTFMIIGIGVLFVNIPFKNLFVRSLRFVVPRVLFIFFVNYYIAVYKDVSHLSVKLKEREHFVMQQKAKGINDIIITEQIMFPKGSLLHEPFLDGYWTNILYSYYYGINSVKLEPNNSSIN